ncbi:hypothetical protein LTR56_004632 [Elasticomyces elasticus]|nr:hypothetical protein LTR56_004632 [Elasticomyces elasticus]KAK3659848.1 hypothetical protein LTR22_008215 [Elasticomyces elasticus]KAK4925972.1 hypothetical protein LTR49_007110 [Elasticomyces elasticus]KAK5768208.1 hypothetical protein LTS12_001692 [Elasticomyces elasticus]
MAPYTHTSALRSGYSSYIMRRFDLIPYLEYTERFQIKSFLMVPPMVTAMVQLAETRPDFVRGCLASLVSGGAGAAPLDPVMQGRMQGLMKEGSLCYQLWAMTETCCVASMTFWPNRVELGSVGRFLEGLDVKLVDEEGEEVPVESGERGEMCVRGPTIMKGYLDNPEANGRDWDEEGYFHTGDVMLRDPKTELWYIVDRRKELIKVRGFQVAPAEIEGVLLSHPGVVDVAVIGVEIGGEEVPRAIVVIKPGEQVSESDVKEWVAGRLAKYKWLNGGVRFVDAIPKTASGKILKRLLREEAKREGREAKLMNERAETSMLNCGTSCTYRIGQYIVKIPRIDFEDAALSEQHLQHAVREANAYRILQSHVRIAKCWHACPIRGLVALEYYRDGTLKAYVDKHGPSRLLTWAKQMVESIQYIHSKGVRHSDLRLDQWLLDSELNVRLSDFNGAGYDGCTVLGIEAQPNSALESGAYFMPRDPELASTVRSDLFALGSSLYVLETGSTPFAQGDDATISYSEGYHRDEAITEQFSRGDFPYVSSLALGSMIKGTWEGRFDSATEMLDVWDSGVRSGDDCVEDGVAVSRPDSSPIARLWSEQVFGVSWKVGEYGSELSYVACVCIFVGAIYNRANVG